MTATDLLPELRRTPARMPSLPVQTRTRRAFARAFTAVMPPARLAPGMQRELIDIGRHGRARLFTPRDGGQGAALLWIHGGGTVIGAAVQDDEHCIRIAEILNIVVLSVEYRLAPSIPSPWLSMTAGRPGPPCSGMLPSAASHPRESPSAGRARAAGSAPLSSSCCTTKPPTTPGDPSGRAAALLPHAR